MTETALNTAYFAEQVALFATVMGVAILLAGLWFAVLTFRPLMPAEKREAGRAKASPTAVVSA